MVESAELSAIYHALAEPNRRAIVQQLSQRGAQSISELQAPLTISLPAVMQHLTVLTDSGLVRTYKRGRARMCQLRPAALDQAQRWITQRRSALNKRLDRLGAYLESQPSTPNEEEP